MQPSEYRTPRGFRSFKSIGGVRGSAQRNRNRHRYSERPFHHDNELLYQSLVQLSGDVEKISEYAAGWGEEVMRRRLTFGRRMRKITE